VSSLELREQVIKARNMQLQRLVSTRKTSNAEMGNKEIEQFCILGPGVSEILQKAVQRLDLSTRAYYRTLKLARTIADLEGVEIIIAPHITEALSYRERSK
jgi:magnesium chelatase family protein